MVCFGMVHLTILPVLSNAIRSWNNVMATMLHADTTPLLEAVAAQDTAATIRETVRLLGARNVKPAYIAARVGIAALWGNARPHALSVLGATGQVADWIRAIPLGAESGDEAHRVYAAAFPLAQGFLAVADSVGAGLREPHPSLPEPLEPADIKHPDGTHGALAEAFSKRDVEQIRRILLGFYATGTDYRHIQEAIYTTLRFRYPTNGFPLTFALSASDVEDMAEWGDQTPALIYWFTPLMVDQSPDTPAAQAAQAFAAQPNNDLSWLRKRLSVPKEEAAGAEFQRAISGGNATAACSAVLTALKNGATPQGVGAGLALAAAERVNAAPTGDRAALVRAGQLLRYAHAVHMAMLHTQAAQIWPLLYTAACAINEAQPGAPTGGVLAISASASAPLGGLIPATMLRSLDQQIALGDLGSALATARRYIQLGNAPRGLVGALALAASLNDATGSADDALAAHALPMVTAAAAEYLALPAALRSGGQNALLAAGVRLATELRGGHSVADQVRAAIEQIG